MRRSDGQLEVAGTIAPYWHQDHIPPLDPGTSYVGVSLYDWNMVGRVGPTSTYVSFAHGCSGSQPAPRLVPRDTPHIRSTLEINVFDLPQNVAFMFFGWQRTLPVSLASHGMPGCDLHISLDAVIFLAGQSGVAKYRLTVPNNPGLVGMHFFNQALALDPGAGNVLGAVVSDAAEGVIGHW